MKQSFPLAAEQVFRKKPCNLIPADEKLFIKAYTAAFKPAYMETYQDVKVDFLGDIYPFSKQIIKPLSKTYPSISIPFPTRLKKLKNAEDEFVLITDHNWKNYFHWFTEEFVRAIAIPQPKKNFIVVLPALAKNFPYIKESLAIAGITKIYYMPLFSKIKLGRVQRVPFFAPAGNYRPWQIKQAQELVWDHFDIDRENKAVKKIFISRKRAKTRRIINEDACLDLLSKFGYHIVYLESYNLEEQVRLFSSAKTTISIHGAGLTNMLWMMPRSKLVEIRDEQDDHNNCFFSLASACDHEYYYLKAQGVYKNRKVQQNDYVVDCKALHKLLAALDTPP